MSLRARETVVVVHGDADLANVAAFRAQMAAAADEGRDVVVVDFGSVRSIDSSCLAVLVGVQRRARDQGRHVRLRNVGEDTMRVLRRSGLDLVLEVEVAQSTS